MTSMYSKQANFWVRDKPKLMGDLNGRPKMLEMVLRNLPNTKEISILDAGCGEGYFTRLLGSHSYEVLGIDINEQMIANARRKSLEESLPSRIHYEIADMTEELPDLKDLDAITAISSIMHLDNHELNCALWNFNEILKPKGQLFIHVPHPALILQGSPVYRETNWLKFNHVEAFTEDGAIYSSPQTTSPHVNYQYFNSNGDHFKGSYWNHSVETYVNSLANAGFNVKEMQTIHPKKEDFLHPSWGTPSPFPIFLQIRAVKETK